MYDTDNKKLLDRAIDELNARFVENSVGYTFKNNQIIRIDNTFIHSDVVIPTLTFLNNKLYDTANSEIMNAFEHHKNF